MTNAWYNVLKLLGGVAVFAMVLPRRAHAPTRARFKGTPIPPPPGSQTYPGLQNLVGAWLHQDYDIHGDTVEEVVTAFRTENSPEWVQQTCRDIRNFLSAHGADDKFLSSSLIEQFRPEPNFFEWEGRSPRETLLYLLDILERPRA